MGNEPDVSAEKKKASEISLEGVHFDSSKY